MGVQWLQRHRERFRQQAGIRWAIVPKGSTDSVGTIGLTITSKAERRAELGIVIGRASWGKGIGTSAAHLVTGYGFSTLGLAEIQAEVLSSPFQNPVTSASRTARGDPGEMLVLLSALRKYLASKMFSTFSWRRVFAASVQKTAASPRV